MILYYVSCNSNFPLCLLCTELANKEQEEVELDDNSDIQTHVSPTHSIPDGHTSDQSQKSGGSPPVGKHNECPVHMPADHPTWNGTNMT